jgi:hypothetical protein
MSTHDKSDGWGTDAPSVLAPERLAAIKQAFHGSSIIVEHRFYRGSRAPDSFVFDDFEELEEYLRTKASAGDSLWFWRYSDLCRDDNSVTHGKYPDPDGLVPSGGAY